MISIDVYKIVHLVGLFISFSAIGALAAYALANAERETPGRKLMGAAHGIGLLLALVGGFGMLARLGFGVAEPWVILKLVIWLVVGGSIALIRRKQDLALAVWGVVLFLGGVAAYLGLYKPFMSGG